MLSENLNHENLRVTSFLDEMVVLEKIKNNFGDFGGGNSENFVIANKKTDKHSLILNSQINCNSLCYFMIDID